MGNYLNYLYWWWTFQHGRTVLFVVTLQFPAYNAPMEGVKLRKLKPGKKQYVPIIKWILRK
jgi:hypothetical protein